MVAAELIGVSEDLALFEDLIKRNNKWVELCFRLETMPVNRALKGVSGGRTWRQEFLFLQDSWRVFQSLPSSQKLKIWSE
jgi:hypothetical protein